MKYKKLIIGILTSLMFWSCDCWVLVDGKVIDSDTVSKPGEDDIAAHFSSDNNEVWVSNYYSGLAEFDDLVSVNTVSSNSSSLNVYPNPVSEVLTFSNQVSAVEVYNMLGAKAEWLFNLPEWNNILTSQERADLSLQYP